MVAPTWFKTPIAKPHAPSMAAARQRQSELLKPVGSLGMLEDAVVQLAGLQKKPHPVVDPARIVVFAADHGVAAAGVSAYPQETTTALVRANCDGRGAISIMARQVGASLEVVDAGMAHPAGAIPGLIAQPVAPGTADFRLAPAMSEAQLHQALEIGAEAVERAVKDGCRLFLGADLGIANSTAAATMTAALLGLPPEALAGPGSGLNEAGMAHKAEVIATALQRHEGFLNSPMEVLRRMGGFELAALCGAYVASGQAGLPVLVDGFAASAAALVAVSVRPNLKEWLFFAHRSAEPGQLMVLRTLKGQPLLNLDLRLGQGTGAAAALPLLRLACALHAHMATSREMGVSPS